MSNRKKCFLIILSVLLIGIVCSCAKMPQPNESVIETADTEAYTASTDELAEEVPVDESADIVADTETEPTEADSTEPEPVQDDVEIEITVADAPADCYTEPGKYEMCMHSDSEYARDVIVTPSAELKNFKFYIYDIEKYMSDNECEISEVLYTSNTVSPQRPFVCRIWVPEFISSYGISYEENGETVMLMFGESGMDGSILLTSY